MGNREKLLMMILRGKSDANIPFDSLCTLLKYMGFEERIKGSHHIFARNDIAEILNIQSKEAMAKTYQVKQIRNVILKYQLGDEIHD
jgi:predicted RNA binding protein YcfA (HicA-like mRNA interferase family)